MEWSSLAGQMKSKFCPEQHCFRLGVWYENHPPDFQRTQSCYKHDCLSPMLWAGGFWQLPSVAQNFPPMNFSFLLNNIFSISSQLRTCSWFVFLLTMVQKNRHSGVAGRIRSWILMLVVLICENFPVKCKLSSKLMDTSLAFEWMNLNF